ncbi:MAG: PAS domain S-box protein, partial [Alphaproteobacteria bacterium]|nr:PAS domain S-box protein [Alphaproteobacteria bacterium]
AAILQHVVPEDQKTFEHCFETALHTGEFDLECGIRHPDQTRHFISAHGKVIFDDTARPVHMLGTVRDITQRRLEQEQLRTSEERMRFFFERQLVGTAITSPQKEWLHVNDALCRMLGYSCDELYGRSWEEITHPDDIAPSFARFERLIANGIDEYTTEKRFIRKDGTVVYAELSVGCVRNQDGSVAYILTLLVDVTERKYIEAKNRIANRMLAQQAEQLKAANAELSQFASVASHDLRAPLRMVTSYLGLIEKKLGPGLDAEMRQFIGFALDGTKRMDALIVGLLEYSRTGRNGAPLEPVPLSDVVRDSLTILEDTIQTAGAVVNVVPEFPVVKGDRIELIRMFQNLIGNAIKYRDANRTPEVSVGWRDDGSAWVVWVKDNGIGIDPKYFERVFAIFQRLVSPGQYEGSGIGLAVCKKAAEHCGGRIWVESVVGEGSTFLVAFPKMVPD